MDRWMVVTCDFEGILTVGIMLERDFDPEVHDDVMPGSRFQNDTQAEQACAAFSQKHGIPEFGKIVSQKFGCPQCGNRNMDSLSLIINDDNNYCICQECGEVYNLISQEVKQKEVEF